jgi:hypothetical protein
MNSSLKIHSIQYVCTFKLQSDVSQRHGYASQDGWNRQVQEPIKVTGASQGYAGALWNSQSTIHIMLSCAPATPQKAGQPAAQTACLPPQAAP